MTWDWQLLRAGAFKLDGGAMFGIVPKPLWTRLVEADERNRIPLQTNCLLLRDERRTVLIECGIGNKQNAKQRDIYDMEDRCVLDALHEVGVRPEDITTVIVSHLHFDHAGGLTRLDGRGQAVPCFPNAEVVSQRTEWEDALANKSTMHSTYLRDHLDPVAGRVRLLHGDAEVFPDAGASRIWARPMPGHTWGQQAIFFKDRAGRTVVFPADLMPTVNHVGLTYNMAYDQIPYENMLRKRAFLGEAAREGWLIALDHEPGNALVRAECVPDKPGAFRLVADVGA